MLTSNFPDRDAPELPVPSASMEASATVETAAAVETSADARPPAEGVRPRDTAVTKTAKSARVHPSLAMPSEPV